jgi:membrane protein
VRRVSAAAYEDNIFFLGSALTFDAILAALPFLLVLLAVLGYAVHAGGDAGADIADLAERLLPAGRSQPAVDRLQRLIQEVVESRGQLSAWGIPLFLWFATRFFSGARAALNDVFDTEETRPFVVGKLVDLLLVVVTLALVSASTWVTLSFGDAPWIGRFVSGLSTFGLGIVLFFIMYIVLPSRSIRWDTAVVAAAVAALGLEIARKLFALYLINFLTLDRAVSNANALAVLVGLLWMYFSACVFLIGGEVADTYDLMRRQHEQRAILA